ncbi:methyltransferase domain-containing protein [Colletotrichum sojae]|uniref:Methyltransferase domain-containing protein n=1 Tax=Colletotrichum sojae TaxID=2175907 RepID=A0A8H6JWY4_9PEZI|nr:methyltransferase domain-containing protein [Colletotrichum sojae]
MTEGQALPTAPPGPPTTTLPAAGMQQQPVAFIELDDPGYETATDAGSVEFQSLASSVRDYKFENERRYHRYKEGRYALPNDEPEQEREDMKHAMVIALCGGALHCAPLVNPQKILDIGTGTGAWAIDMGDEYPGAEVIGNDLSPIQPEYLPPNVRFIIDDAEAEWLHPDNSVDFVHLRHMAPAIKDWPRLLAQAYRVLKPGGWIELQELNAKFNCDDGTMSPDCSLTRLIGHIRAGLASFGIDLFAADSNPQRLQAAGFGGTFQDVRKLPVGNWPRHPEMKTIGEYCRAVIYDGLHAISMGPITRGLGWTRAQVEVLLDEVRADLLSPGLHSYVYLHTVVGQKPVS